ILDRVPAAHLLLLAWPAGLVQPLAARLAPRLGAAMARVHFLPPVGHHEFLERMAACDAILDPFHFGGGNTSYEALAMAAPVVTLPAAFLRGRFTFGCYRELGLDACIAHDEAHYVELAVRLATEPDFRHDVSRRLAERAGALFERSDAALALGRWL